MAMVMVAMRVCASMSMGVSICMGVVVSMRVRERRVIHNADV